MSLKTKEENGQVISKSEWQRRRVQEKDSNKITQERVELIKTISDQKSTLIFGYVRKNAFNTYALDIP